MRLVYDTKAPRSLWEAHSGAAFRVARTRIVGCIVPKTTTLFVRGDVFSPTAKSVLGNGGFNCPCLRIEAGGTFVRWGP